MRKLITRTALLTLVGTSVAVATNRNKILLLADEPVGHRQPRVDQEPSEKNLMDPNQLLVLKGLTH